MKTLIGHEANWRMSQKMIWVQIKKFQNLGSTKHSRAGKRADAGEMINLSLKFLDEQSEQFELNYRKIAAARTMRGE